LFNLASGGWALNGDVRLATAITIATTAAVNSLVMDLKKLAVLPIAKCLGLDLIEIDNEQRRSTAAMNQSRMAAMGISPQLTGLKTMDNC
jgi:hypothetical protein